MTSASLDCTRCGACCFNPPENVAEGYVDYVEVERRDALLRRSELLKRYAREREGRWHLVLLEGRRCKALEGRLGERVRCSIYHVRPSPCRRVQAGSELCERYRREQGVPLTRTRPGARATSARSSG